MREIQTKFEVLELNWKRRVDKLFYKSKCDEEVVKQTKIVKLMN